MDYNIQPALEFLDAHRPGWHNEIDDTTLDITSAFNCVLAQIAKSEGSYPSYGGGRRLLDMPLWMADELCCNYQSEWVQAINDRRSGNVVDSEKVMCITHGGKVIQVTRNQERVDTIVEIAGLLRQTVSVETLEVK